MKLCEDLIARTCLSVICTIYAYTLLHVFTPVATQGGDNTAATVGGVLGTALILSLTVIVIVLVVVLLKNRGGHSFSGMQRRYVIYKHYVLV